ncbi:hypothetical protein DID88_009771 [Monilinia fructigena]|uniref:Uncharacterized protein n=1 Tax=Monilinia fructigena TaxID=38457 RepID=A0A395IK24_9HELO|nr:hypothetical protein DID88_009771 [Monilinia fructigena]
MNNPKNFLEIGPANLAPKSYTMNTLPPRNINEDSMEKGEHEVYDVVINTFLDVSTSQPLRPDGVTDEQFKRSLPDNRTERFLQYLRGIKNRKQVKDRIIPIIELYPEGYPQLAAVIDSDEQFMLYRRFGHLVYANRWPARLRSRDICNAESNDHKDVLLLIEEKYKEYGEPSSVLDRNTCLIIATPFSSASDACTNPGKLR